MESVVAPLAEQLEHARRRADDAVAAERIAALENAGLRVELDQECRRGGEMVDRADRELINFSSYNYLGLCGEMVDRADRAECLLEAERERSDKLQTSLADAVGAERIAAGEAAALRAELDRSEAGACSVGCAGRCAAAVISSDSDQS
jgi:7-keto-8-aminopelargonate synthetase-like enzyme